MSENKSLFPGLRVPGPPKDLRRQVLNRARQAMENGPRHDFWSRIWENRQVRLAWGVSVLALVVSNLVLPVGDAGPPRRTSTLVQTEADEHEELAAITNLPKVSLDVLPVFAATGRPEETETEESEL